MMSHPEFSDRLPFIKMHGLGNDFVMLDAKHLSGLDARHLPNVDEQVLSALTRQMCDRHRGVGADGLIVAAPPTDASRFDSRFIYFNANGEQAEMCGNGIRCFALFVHKLGLVSRNKFRVETLAGLIEPEILSCTATDANVRVNMGPPRLTPSLVPFIMDALDDARPALNVDMRLHGQSFPINAVSMGNPHAVIFQDSVSDGPLDPAVFGPLLEVHPAFTARTNVEFVTIKPAQANEPLCLETIVWERGCGFTQACGTGACAVAVAAILTERVPAGAPVQVGLPGGRLDILWSGHPQEPVWMTGPAQIAFEGVWTLNAR
ncbi:MAG: diaminopimelate epimerase [Vampirovibrionales bacterium]|nr:diaminopimelate epimerase [Vampirovibrionales bacterium]